MSADILLVGLNARFRHTSFGLRCLQANLGELQTRSMLLEATINDRPVDVLEKILAEKPLIVGFGVYIWNLLEALDLLRMLRRVAPEIKIVVGGPEVSHELEGQPILDCVDYVVCGEGEQAFKNLCEQLLSGQEPALKVIPGGSPPMSEIASAYHLYSESDLAQRVVYVEASRGCPFRCEFCLSSLDKKVREVPLELFLQQMEELLDRGAKDFKFIDRTFNLSMPFALGILDFFYARLRPGLSLHFEMVPERLPEKLLHALARFPSGVVQLEVGVQTFNEEVARLISRPLKTQKIASNLKALHQETSVHMHVDLIAGLPGEDIEGFGLGFDRLQALGPHEIQLGILKRLKGTPISRHSEKFAMVYNDAPPFEVLKTGALSFEQLQELKRFARFWDLLVNNGQLPASSPLIWRQQASVFSAFREFAGWLFKRAGRSNKISLIKLAEYLLDFLIECRGLSEAEVGPLLVADLSRLGGRRLPKRLQVFEHLLPKKAKSSVNTGLKRQARHAAKV
jgi:radical SAM superfamily enzyme YgiQ (UPF0313 family)